MPPRRRENCQVCNRIESKYACSKCRVLFCSDVCYKEHKSGADKSSNLPLAESARPLRKLSSLKWPYVPDAPSYPDPLTRDDPKPLNLSQYEAIATSPAVRRALASHPRLPSILRSLDQLRGPEREEALQRVLGVAPTQAGFSLAGISSASPANYSSSAASGSVGRGRGAAAVGVNVDEEDMRALRALAEAIESVVRGTGGTADPLGLDWETMGDA
ncbi:hypothetical protein DFH11DRAFT_1685992 [Phellopilus nigrolimitatus]|nr:hypothetical protein DFH11DRAFT_1685992 [Phellopilus nigrolimitatus]